MTEPLVKPTVEPAVEHAVAAHERRLATLDPLLPHTHPLPAPEPGDALLTTGGGVALARRERPDPHTMAAIWGAIEQHRLLPRVGGPEPVSTMAGLLAQWGERVAAQAAPDDPDSEAVLSWPARDYAMTRLFLAHGLAPLATVAARPAGRPGPEPGGGARIRQLAPADVEAALTRWLDVVHWDAQFNIVTERPATAEVQRTELREVATRAEPWAWVAERDGELDGLLMIDPPERAGWIAPLTSASPTAYLGTLVVTAGRRGAGLGAALVRHGHRALDAAGAAQTLLHYAGLNPLSGPFWHRCGYRPLWTVWRVRPASRLSPRPGSAGL